MDPLFQVQVLSQTHKPQTLIWQALHQDYSSKYLPEDSANTPDETEAGNIAVKKLLKGDRGHYGPLEHPQITFAVGYFPHSTMQQMRTHRVGVSFDVQSFRYTSEAIRQLGDLCLHRINCSSSLDNEMDDLAEAIEKVFYLRPLGEYTDRTGKRYAYTEDQRHEDLVCCAEAAMRYVNRYSQGMSEEHARQTLPFDLRQHWVLSANLRALMHLLDLRWKKDAQLECQVLCGHIWPHFEEWAPEIARWYLENRATKARLSP